MLKLQLFGSGQASYCDRSLTGFPNRQSHRVLCYLLLNRHYPHYRERLAAVFWGDYPTATSRTYLRSAIWRLRSALQSVGASVDEYLLTSDDSISFLVSSRYSLDVEDFERTTALYEDLAGQQLTPEQANHLKGAVELYVGDLLQGIYEDWCLYDRERLRLLHLNGLSKLLAFHEHNGSYERGLAYGRQILARDPTRERVHRQMMRLYWLLGRRNEALTQYKCCAQILRQELGIPPMNKTQLLHKQMMRNQFEAANWPVLSHELLPDRIRQDESIQSLTKHALQKLHRLQVMTEETNTELHHIERLINKALVDSKHA